MRRCIACESEIQGDGVVVESGGGLDFRVCDWRCKDLWREMRDEMIDGGADDCVRINEVRDLVVKRRAKAYADKIWNHVRDVFVYGETVIEMKNEDGNGQ